MGFRFDPSLRVQDEVQRVARERIDRALGQLQRLEVSSPSEIEEAVHETRKACKELRATARLVRSEIGSEFAPFNRMVGRAAEELSSVRDAHALLATLDNLVIVQGKRDAHRKRDDRDLGYVRSSQAVVAQEATRCLRGDDTRIGQAIELLTVARKRVGWWQVADDLSWLRAGIAKTYAAGRRDLGRATKRPTDERLHDWRKTVKRLWYQVRLVEATAPSVLTPLIARLDDLAEALGDDHDLAVLIECLESNPERYGGRRPTKRAIKAARKQRDDLRRRAFRLGASLFVEPAESFVTRIAAYWRTAVRLGPELATSGIADLAADDLRVSTGTMPERADSIERERTFLIDSLPDAPTDGTLFRQGYLAIDGRVSARVRDAGADGCSLTIKAGKGAVRLEFEWPLSNELFEQAWPHTVGRRVNKTRHRVVLDPDVLVAEVDVFHEDLKGLVLAEVEFDTDDEMADFESPAWFGDEVTDDERYSNAALAVHGWPTSSARPPSTERERHSS